jgi:hypothetical protein
VKGSQVSNWRTVQVFISPNGVFEAELRPDDKNPRCNCPAYVLRNDCKHADFIKKKMEENDGHYAILVPEEVPEELADAAQASAESFREFIINYARVEVL